MSRADSRTHSHQRHSQKKKNVEMKRRRVVNAEAVCVARFVA
jgi:hypothetical protein